MVKRRVHQFLLFNKYYLAREGGMIYPHILLILVLVAGASVSAADSFVTKWKTADYLTHYYEMRIVELVAIRDVLSQPDPQSFSMRTNRGTTNVNILNTSEKERQIQITTVYENGSFQATYYYDRESELMVKRTEYN